jgi:hypothetical protein
MFSDRKTGSNIYTKTSLAFKGFLFHILQQFHLIFLTLDRRVRIYAHSLERQVELQS